MKNEFKLSKAIFTIMGFIFLLLAASCGGGGGGGDGGDKGGGEPLGTYGFSLGFLDDYPIQIISGTGSTITLEALPGVTQLSGSYSLDTETISLDGGPMVKVTTDIWDGPLGTLSINLNSPIESSEGNHPTEGEVRIFVGEDPLEPEYFVTFTINDTEVNIRLNDDDPLPPYTWDEFEELLWSEVDENWRRQASFGYYIINYYFYEVKFVANAIMLIEENDTVLPAESVTIDGDAFPGEPPLGHDAQGALVLSCTGGDGGPGSDFSEGFDDYWVNDLSDNIDHLYEGTVDFVGFLENSDEARDVITSIGFVPNGEVDPGGVFYDGDGLTIFDTEETLPGEFAIGNTAWINITGRYSIRFFEPEP